MKAVLAPIDFSRTSDLVVQVGASLARAIGGKVVLLTVVAPSGAGRETTPLQKRIAQIDHAREKAMARRLAAVQDRLRADSIPADAVVLRGNPVMQILQRAAEDDAAFIVMGSHGHTAFYDLIAGSTTHGVLKRAHCPVLILPEHMPKPRCKRHE